MAITEEHWNALDKNTKLCTKIVLSVDIFTKMLEEFLDISDVEFPCVMQDHSTKSITIECKSNKDTEVPEGAVIPVVALNTRGLLSKLRRIVRELERLEDNNG